jgi:hypothetical protein
MDDGIFFTAAITEVGGFLANLEFTLDYYEGMPDPAIAAREHMVAYIDAVSFGPAKPPQWSPEFLLGKGLRYGSPGSSSAPISRSQHEHPRSGIGRLAGHPGPAHTARVPLASMPAYQMQCEQGRSILTGWKCMSARMPTRWLSG